MNWLLSRMRLFRAAPALLAALRDMEDEFNILGTVGDHATTRKHAVVMAARRAITAAGAYPIGESP